MSINAMTLKAQVELAMEQAQENLSDDHYLANVMLLFKGEEMYPVPSPCDQATEEIFSALMKSVEPDVAIHIASGWSSTLTLGQEPKVAPSKDPQRKLVIVVCGFSRTEQPYTLIQEYTQEVEDESAPVYVGEPKGDADMIHNRLLSRYFENRKAN